MSPLGEGDSGAGSRDGRESLWDRSSGCACARLEPSCLRFDSRGGDLSLQFVSQGTTGLIADFREPIDGQAIKGYVWRIGALSSGRCECSRKSS